MITHDVLLAWAAALDSEYMSIADVERWADQHILALDDPPLWLIDLSLTSCRKTALIFLWKGWEQQMEACRECVDVFEYDFGKLYLGFLYLRYVRNDLSLAELLKMAGRKSDAMDCGVGCETFYMMLNEIDGGGPVIPSDRPLADRVQEQFSPFAELARRRMALALVNA